MTESEGVSKRFDPRFSPAFQPGYDPRVHREAPPAAPLREEPRRGWTEAGRDLPEEREEFPIFAIPESAGTEAEEATLEEVEPAPWWRRFNPWLVLLWVIGVAFILGGIWFVSAIEGWSRTQQTGFDSYLMSLIYQMSWLGVPLLIVLGLATLTSTVVILAARWRRP